MHFLLFRMYLMPPLLDKNKKKEDCLMLEEPCEVERADSLSSFSDKETGSETLCLAQCHLALKSRFNAGV